MVRLWTPTGTGSGYGTGLYSVFILPSGTEGWAVGDEEMMLHYSLRSAPAPRRLLRCLLRMLLLLLLFCIGL